MQEKILPNEEKNISSSNPPLPSDYVYSEEKKKPPMVIVILVVLILAGLAIASYFLVPSIKNPLSKEKDKTILQKEIENIRKQEQEETNMKIFEPQVEDIGPEGEIEAEDDNIPTKSLFQEQQSE